MIAIGISRTHRERPTVEVALAAGGVALMLAPSLIRCWAYPAAPGHDRAGRGQPAEFVSGVRSGSGSTRLTMKAYAAAPTRPRQPTATSGTTNEPVTSYSAPTANGLPTPARSEAKFWMPPIEATWPSVGATSAGSDHTLAGANGRLAELTDSSASATAALGTMTASAITEENSIPATRQILRALLRSPVRS